MSNVIDFETIISDYIKYLEYQVMLLFNLYNDVPIDLSLITNEYIIAIFNEDKIGKVLKELNKSLDKNKIICEVIILSCTNFYVVLLKKLNIIRDIEYNNYLVLTPINQNENNQLEFIKIKLLNYLEETLHKLIKDRIDLKKFIKEEDNHIIQAIKSFISDFLNGSKYRISYRLIDIIERIIRVIEKTVREIKNKQGIQIGGVKHIKTYHIKIKKWIHTS